MLLCLFVFLMLVQRLSGLIISVLTFQRNSPICEFLLYVRPFLGANDVHYRKSVISVVNIYYLKPPLETSSLGWLVNFELYVNFLFGHKCYVLTTYYSEYRRVIFICVFPFPLLKVLVSIWFNCKPYSNGVDNLIGKFLNFLSRIDDFSFKLYWYYSKAGHKHLLLLLWSCELLLDTRSEPTWCRLQIHNSRNVVLNEY